MNRYTILRRVSAGIVSVALAGGLAGCGSTVSAAQPTGALALVVGAHGNAPAPELAGHAASARDMAVAQQSFFSVVVADGAPFVADSGVLESAGETAAAQQEQRAENRKRVDDAVAGARAATPETDLLSALRVAAESIQAQPGHRSIVVVDSGLSTTGALDFRDPDLLDAVPEEVADFLGKNEQLPVLAGVSVHFVGLGNTVEPQAPLSSLRRAQLDALWTTLARTAGASYVEVERSPAGAPPPADLPPVTPVPVPPGYSCEGETMRITGGDLSFVHDTDVWADPKAAERVFVPLADQMKARQLSAILRGTAADLRDPAEQQMLSYLQAQAVANLWLEEGVPQQKLTVVGLGSSFPGRVPERDADGNLDPVAAAANRTITIVFSDEVVCP